MKTIYFYSLIDVIDKPLLKIEFLAIKLASPKLDN